MSTVLAIAQPHRIKRSHRRRGKVASGRFVQRYYDPVIGRFLSVDPVETDPNSGDSFNRYAYANNNPYLFVDPDGRDGACFYGPSQCGMRQLTPEQSQRRESAMKGLVAIAAVPALIYGGFELGVLWLANPAAANIIAAEVMTGGAVVASGGGMPSPGIASAPRIFANLAPLEQIGQAATMHASQIVKVSYSGRLNYVVTEAGKLVIGKTGHTSLSGGANVLAAGEARFVNGALKSLNNASGHYKPSGPSAAEAAESAFERAGFKAAETYKEKH
ncbi:MAG: RHS repeat-associated core domain-containing protein [Arenimonas sp.]